MWTTILAGVVGFGLLFAAMAVGLLRGRELRGSCGGKDGADCICTAADQAACELRKLKEAADLRGQP
jgi:hypothetical protein